MDHSGDSRYSFGGNDLEALAKAEERFKGLVGRGFTPAARSAAGEVRIARLFDPTAQEMLFYPRLVGG
ncbi:hypothetical protein [Bradyrhizobium genosp. A]|uniref:hypothetical protein n=1 Tax=Bradyrhizobium genosp. A TaxID=83626 RepID=UPI003CE8DE2E